MRDIEGQEDKSERKFNRKVKTSSITRRILAINIFALAVLVFGLLYVGKYRQGLIQNEIAALMTQAKMFAAALGEAAIRGGKSNQYYLQKETSGQIIRRLTATTLTHAQLITKNGQILIDSKLLAEPGGLVQVEELPPPDHQNSFTRFILESFDQILWLIDNALQRSPFEITKFKRHTIRPEVWEAITGEYRHAILQGKYTPLSLSVAVPVQRYKHILGALNLVKNGNAIENAVFEVRLGILKVFGFSLLVTILLSIYLARTIAQPLRRLAATANLVRQGLSRQYIIPDLGRRSDEIGLLSEALKDMTEALWERMDAIERFAADVTHEIKNPLTSIRSAIETTSKVRDPEKHKKLISIILDDIQRLDRLISDIADASRLDAELSRAKMEPFDIGILLGKFKEMYHELDNLNNAKFALIISHDVPMIVLGLKDRIVQVLRNLLGNAISFSPSDGTITIKVEPWDNAIAVMVEDEGPGISESSLTQIFNRFYQDRPLQEKFGTHSGLGLSISKQIIETHGGEIWAENRKSSSGKILGTRVTFLLPSHN